VATVQINYNGGNVPILMGLQPTAPNQPISNPKQVGALTNSEFVLGAGIYCFCLDDTRATSPIWMTQQIIDGITNTFAFVLAP